MPFFTISLKICVSSAVFYSTFSLSKCRAGDIPESPWQQDNKIFHIYKAEVPWTAIELEENRNNFAFMACVISMALILAGILCLCIVCWKVCRKLESRRQFANTVQHSLIPSAPEAVLAFQTDVSDEVHGRIRNSTTTTSNIYGNYVGNFASKRSLQVPYLPSDDDPPEYSTVVYQTSQNCSPITITPFPLVIRTKAIETPPPVYISEEPVK